MQLCTHKCIFNDAICLVAGVAAVCTIHVLVFTVAIKQPQLQQSETNRLYVANRCATFISFGPYMTIIVARFSFAYMTMKNGRRKYSPCLYERPLN